MVDWLPMTPTRALSLDELFQRLQDAKGKGQLDDFEAKMLPRLYGAWKGDRLSEKQMAWIHRTVHEIRTGKRNHEPVIDYVDE